MKDLEIQKVLKKIQKVMYHLGTFEGSVPKILKEAPIYSRSHLIVLLEVLPYLRHLLKFSSETVPIVGKILGLAEGSKSDLEQASDHLKTINQSSEMAVTEIFTALDQVGALLRKAQEEGAGEDLKTTLGEANMQLMSIMNALQFQDITAQKIEATNALLAHLGDGMVSLIKQLGVSTEDHSITYRKGTYDDQAAFDRDMAGSKQDDIDQLLEGNLSVQEAPAPKKAEKTVQKAPPKKVETDDIDALVDQASEPTPAETVAQDDIDALIDSAGANGDASETVAQDDIDALIDSAGEETTEDASETVAQDDIDALIDSAGDDNA